MLARSSSSDKNDRMWRSRFLVPIVANDWLFDFIELVVCPNSLQMLEGAGTGWEMRSGENISLLGIHLDNAWG